MRTTQFIGLTEEARNWVRLNVRKLPNLVCCPHCHTHFATGYTEDKRWSSRVIAGMCDEEIPLLNYVLANGHAAYEVKDRVVWSSGPMIFTCLEIDGEKAFQWTDEQIAEYG